MSVANMVCAELALFFGTANPFVLALLLRSKLMAPISRPWKVWRRAQPFFIRFRRPFGRHTVSSAVSAHQAFCLRSKRFSGTIRDRASQKFAPGSVAISVDAQAIRTL